MTPTEQDKELREKLLDAYRYTSGLPIKGLTSEVEYHTLNGRERLIDMVMQLITVDRKRVALEARIDELEHWKNSVHENTGNRGGSAIKAFNTAVRYFRENIDIRIVELKQELERL